MPTPWSRLDSPSWITNMQSLYFYCIFHAQKWPFWCTPTMEVETKGVPTAQLQRDNVCCHEWFMNNETINISRALQARYTGNLVATNTKTRSDFLGQNSPLDVATGHVLDVYDTFCQIVTLYFRYLFVTESFRNIHVTKETEIRFFILKQNVLFCSKWL